MLNNRGRVQQFLDDLQLGVPDKYKIVSEIRDIFCTENSDIEEDIKYGGIIFNLEGSLIGGVYPSKNHVSIEFSHGAELKDNDKILEGKGKHRRHIKIRQAGDIQSKNVSKFVKAIFEL